MSKKQSKPTGTFTAGALLATGTTPDSPAVITGISETSGFLIPASGIDLGTATARVGAGAVPVTGSICEITTSGTAQALTLANGIEGQLLTITYKAEGAAADSAVLTPANPAGFATITFSALGDAATLLFTSGKWYILSLDGTIGQSMANIVSARAGAGAVPVTAAVCEYTSAGAAEALTLADGVEGQALTVTYKAEAAAGDSAILTVSNGWGVTTIPFNVVGDTATLRFISGKWCLTAYVNVLETVRTNIPTARSGPGAVALTSKTVHYTSTATGNALTLADGVEGQTITIIYIAEAAGADTGILTPANRGGYATITFNAIGDTATLIFTNTRWYIVGTRGVTIA